MHGTLRVVLTELNSSWPFFGKLNISFVSAPSLSFRLAKAASIFNIAGFRYVFQIQYKKTSVQDAMCYSNDREFALLYQ